MSFDVFWFRTSFSETRATKWTITQVAGWKWDQSNRYDVHFHRRAEYCKTCTVNYTQWMHRYADIYGLPHFHLIWLSSLIRPSPPWPTSKTCINGYPSVEYGQFSNKHWLWFVSNVCRDWPPPRLSDLLAPTVLTRLCKFELCAPFRRKYIRKTSSWHSSIASAEPIRASALDEIHEWSFRSLNHILELMLRSPKLGSIVVSAYLSEFMYFNTWTSSYF